SLLPHSHSSSPPCASFLSTILHPPSPPLFPYTTLFRSGLLDRTGELAELCGKLGLAPPPASPAASLRFLERDGRVHALPRGLSRSEEHTSELQSLTNLVCRLLLEKKKQIIVSVVISSNT